MTTFGTDVHPSDAIPGSAEYSTTARQLYGSRISARRITAVTRQLFPGIAPLSTTRNLSPNGMILSYTLTMPAPAAYHWGVESRSGAPVSDYLTRALNRPVHITNVTVTCRRDGSKLAHITIETGKS